MTDLTQLMMQAVAEGEELHETPRKPYDTEVCLAGTLVKLGQRIRNWKERWVVVRGDGQLQYYKGRPTPQRGLGLMTPQGAINLRRDCVELLTWNSCAHFLQQMTEEASALRAPVRWPPAASARNAFGIRTPIRTYLFYAPEGEARMWLDGLSQMCHGADAFLGIDAVPRTPIADAEQTASSLRRTRSTPNGRPSAAVAAAANGRNPQGAAARRGSAMPAPHHSAGTATAGMGRAQQALSTGLGATGASATSGSATAAVPQTATVAERDAATIAAAETGSSGSRSREATSGSCPASISANGTRPAVSRRAGRSRNTNGSASEGNRVPRTA